MLFLLITLCFRRFMLIATSQFLLHECKTTMGESFGLGALAESSVRASFFGFLVQCASPVDASLNASALSTLYGKYKWFLKQLIIVFAEVHLVYYCSAAACCFGNPQNAEVSFSIPGGKKQCAICRGASYNPGEAYNPGFTDWVCAKEHHTCAKHVHRDKPQMPHELAKHIRELELQEDEPRENLANRELFLAFLLLNSEEREAQYRFQFKTSTLKNWGHRCNFHSTLRLWVASFDSKRCKCWFQMPMSEYEEADDLTALILVFMFVHTMSKKSDSNPDLLLPGTYPTTEMFALTCEVMHCFRRTPHPDNHLKLHTYLDVGEMYTVLLLDRFDSEDHSKKQRQCPLGRGGDLFRSLFVIQSKPWYFCTTHHRLSNTSQTLGESRTFCSSTIDLPAVPVCPTSSHTTQGSQLIMDALSVPVCLQKTLDSWQQGEKIDISNPPTCPTCKIPSVSQILAGWLDSAPPETLTLGLKRLPATNVSAIHDRLLAMYSGSFPIVCDDLTRREEFARNWSDIEAERLHQMVLCKSVAGIGYYCGWLQLQLQSELYKQRQTSSEVNVSNVCLDLFCHLNISLPASVSFLQIAEFFTSNGFSERTLNHISASPDNVFKTAIPHLSDCYKSGRGTPNLDNQYLQKFSNLEVAAIIAYLLGVSKRMERSFGKYHYSPLASSGDEANSFPNQVDIPTSIQIQGQNFDLVGAIIRKRDKCHYVGDFIHEGNLLSQDDAAKVQTVTTERVSTTTGYENCGTMVRQQHRLQKT